MWWLEAWHGLVFWTGTDYGAGAYGRFEPYDAYSGILGLSATGALVQVIRRSNCEVRWCWRIARHDQPDPVTAGLVHHLCRRHHPGHPGRQLTYAGLQRRLHLYLGDRPGRG